MSMKRPRIYAAHPIVTYGSARERDCLAALRSLLPGVELYNPAWRYRTDASWRRAWRRVLPSLDGLVVFGTRSNVVGLGCLRELADARRIGLRVAMLDERCRPRTIMGSAATKKPTAKRAAVLLPGECVDFAWLLATTRETEQQVGYAGV